MTAERVLFCEGEEAVLFQRLAESLSISVRQAGGKDSLRNYARGYFRAKDVITERYLIIRDRDFDRKPSDTPSLISMDKGGKEFALYRTCIENYLLEPSVIFSFWQSRESQVGWRHGAARPENEINQKLEAAARDIVNHQAVKWALASLNPDCKWPKFISLHSSASAPHHLLNFELCLKKATKALTDFISKANSVTVTLLRQHAEVFKNIFEHANWIQSREYLVWFDGKDLLTHLERKLNKKGLMSGYKDWAYGNVDWRQFPDLCELHQKLREL